MNIPLQYTLTKFTLYPYTSMFEDKNNIERSYLLGMT